MFKRMEIDERISEEGIPSKTPIRADTNRAIHGRKRKGGEAASPTNPQKGRTSKIKTNHSGHPTDRPTGTKTCLVHGPGHYI